MRVPVLVSAVVAGRADQHPLPGSAEDAEHLRRFFPGAAEPMRRLSVELRRLARPKDQVLGTEDERTRPEST
jgi:hypothetical protein